MIPFMWPQSQVAVRREADCEILNMTLPIIIDYYVCQFCRSHEREVCKSPYSGWS
jgi:hypothetical protein